MASGVAFRDRPLSEREFEILRLALSSFRDGSGQQNLPGGSMPGFRDFERSLAAVLGGKAPENKGIFDVFVPAVPRQFGISCKMAAMPPIKGREHHSFWEMSNSAATFRDSLLASQINWATEPGLAGPAIIDLMESRYTAREAVVDLAGSRYAVLAHDRQWETFQLLCFPLNLKIVNPRGEIEWLHEGAALNGYMDDGGRRHRLWQLYPNSGGQLKYYPPLGWADWVTASFHMEVPPLVSPLAKARTYFEAIWPGD